MFRLDSLNLGTRMRTAILAGLGILFLGVAGCGQVRSLAPVDPDPAKIDPNVYQGIWQSTYGGISVSVVVTDAEHGRLRATWLETSRNAGSVPHVQQAELELRGSRADGRPRFLNIRFEPEMEGYEGAPPWMLASIEIEERKHFARLLIPEAVEFQQLVESGTLPGTVERGYVYLGELDAKQLKGITPLRIPPEGHSRTLFHFDFPYYDFKRISDDPGSTLLYPGS